MMVHPVRMTGMVIGAAQTYDYFEMIQDRILSFVSEHSRISYDGLKALMHNTKMLTRDLGTVLVGKDAVEKGLIDQVGGIREALAKLYGMIGENRFFRKKGDRGKAGIKLAGACCRGGGRAFRPAARLFRLPDPIPQIEVAISRNFMYTI